MMREWNIQIMNEYPQFNIVGEIWTNYTIGTAWWQKGCKLNFGKRYGTEVCDGFYSDEYCK